MFCKVSENDKNKKNVKGNLAFFALDPKLGWATKTLILHSDLKFMCLVVANVPRVGSV